jgi:hypothetical protein
MVLPLDGYRRPACSLAVDALPDAMCAIVLSVVIRPRIYGKLSNIVFAILLPVDIPPFNPLALS